MSNVTELEISPFVNFIWEQHRHQNLLSFYDEFTNVYYIHQNWC